MLPQAAFLLNKATQNNTQGSANTSPPSWLLRGQVSGSVLCGLLCFTVKSAHILIRAYTWGPTNLLTFIWLEQPLSTICRCCRQSYLPVWGTAASCSWHESCPSNEMLPLLARRRSCCRWDNTCSCLPRCCLLACYPVHTEPQRG